VDVFFLKHGVHHTTTQALTAVVKPCTELSLVTPSSSN